MKKMFTLFVFKQALHIFQRLMQKFKMVQIHIISVKKSGQSQNM